MSVADREHLRELASLHALGVLSPEERAQLAAAVVADPELAAEVRALEDTAGALGGVVPQVDPPARLRARVLAAAGVDSEGTAGEAAPETVRPRGGATPEPFRAAPARGGSRALPAWLAAAAAMILASGLGLWALQLRTQLDDMRVRVARAEADVTEMRRVIDRSQAETRVLQARNDLLFAPDTERVDLAGQAAAPGSSARAFMSRQSGLAAFAASQLPALPADKVYQLWVIPQGHAPVHAGLLQPDASGRASLFFDMPAGLPPPEVVAVTIEPAGGVPAPTGAMVLVGKVAAAVAAPPPATG